MKKAHFKNLKTTWSLVKVHGLYVSMMKAERVTDWSWAPSCGGAVTSVFDNNNHQCVGCHASCIIIFSWQCKTGIVIETTSLETKPWKRTIYHLSARSMSPPDSFSPMGMPLGRALMTPPAGCLICVQTRSWWRTATTTLSVASPPWRSPRAAACSWPAMMTSTATSGTRWRASVQVSHTWTLIVGSLLLTNVKNLFSSCKQFVFMKTPMWLFNDRWRLSANDVHVSEPCCLCKYSISDFLLFNSRVRLVPLRLWYYLELKDSDEVREMHANWIQLFWSVFI